MQAGKVPCSHLAWVQDWKLHSLMNCLEALFSEYQRSHLHEHLNRIHYHHTVIVARKHEHNILNLKWLNIMTKGFKPKDNLNFPRKGGNST